VSSELNKELGARFKSEVDRLSSVSSVAGTLGVSRGTVYNWFESGQLGAVDLALLIPERFDIAFILTGVRSAASGKGGALSYPDFGRSEHLSSEDVASGLDYGQQRSGTIPVKVGDQIFAIDPDDYQWIPFFDIEFGAGGGRAVLFDQPPKSFNAYRKDYLRDRGLLDAELFEAVVIGDSMDPLIIDRDAIMVNASDKAIRSGEIYAIQMGAEFICKYLRRLPEGRIEISSENAKKHPAFTIREEELNNGVVIVGCVVPLGRY
jgi:phage repressor protein C with HTH and peptisase S24 domain